MTDTTTDHAFQRSYPHPCLADIAEQLMAEFGSRIDLEIISRAVLAAAHDLTGPTDAADVGLEHLARQRLHMLVAAD
jgi:hypothetical protein